VGCAGAFVLLLLVLTGCKDSPFRRETKLDIGTDTITLAKGVTVHDIVVQSVTGGEFQPAAVEIRTGDVVRFRMEDSRTHVLAFDDAGTPEAVRQLFRTKSQDRSPPLVAKGATWIVSFEAVPAGNYTYRCATHGVSGRVTVR
jgi:plastocyanin